MRIASLAAGCAVLLLSIAPVAGESQTCSIPTACYLAVNSGTGAGIEATSAGSAGIWGITTYNAGSSPGGYGVFGQDRSTSGKLDYGVYGTSTNGTGIGGRSQNSFGASGVSSKAFGVYGVSAATAGVYGIVEPPASPAMLGGTAGVVGVNAASSINAAGVIGKTAGAGWGMAAISGNGALGSLNASATTGTAVLAQASVGDAVVASSAKGGDAIRASAIGGGNALVAESDSGAAAAVITSNNAGGDTGQYLDYAAQISNSGINTGGLSATGDNIGVFSASGGYPFYAGPLNSGVFYVDSSGNVYYQGTLTASTSAAQGRRTAVFAPQATAPTLEDVGSAQLTHGRASVSLGSEFAASLDPHETYHVFLTPEGDSRGLYVASKSSTGFTVRENEGGRATLAFDYRVVGVGLGKTGKRIAFVQRGHEPGRLPGAPVARPFAATRP